MSNAIKGISHIMKGERVGFGEEGEVAMTRNWDFMRQNQISRQVLYSLGENEGRGRGGGCAYLDLRYSQRDWLLPPARFLH